MKNAIVTGANGFVGTWLVKKLCSQNVQVTAIIKDTNENIDDIKSYFDKFPYESMEDSNKYDFETDNINEGDYYSLRAGSNNDNYSVFLYDVNSHILYYIHYNI